MKKLSIVVFLIASHMMCMAQESVLLRYKYNKGDQYEMTMNMKQEMGAAGGMNMKIQMAMNISEAKGGIYTSTIKVKNISMDMLQGGNVMSYDSTKSDDELDEMGKQMKAQFEPFMKATIMSTSNSLGEVSESTVEPNVPALTQFKEQSNSIEYPEEKVAVDSTWSTEKNEQGMKMKMTYKVTEITKETVFVEVSGDVSGGGTGKITGKVEIDRVTGVQSKNDMEASIDAGGLEMKIFTNQQVRKL
ncbi:MAG: hypothetical protein GKR88_06215 [Flavobacteriaceae bacterium]|nr:MAG: hypothetical protein GKR88_06215 [Flavobacteriaceae bacterium]